MVKVTRSPTFPDEGTRPVGQPPGPQLEAEAEDGVSSAAAATTASIT
ncbi:MAG TPA: hypothetical protein VJ488_04020 [Dehalococcoidia bacterium]|nr:hypothetical protein [Dehalococcoidia bacterium]